MIKKDYLRILECTLLNLDGMSEININKLFNFEEIDKVKQIIKIIKK